MNITSFSSDQIWDIESAQDALTPKAIWRFTRLPMHGAVARYRSTSIVRSSPYLWENFMMQYAL